jgi:hypothetical protein
MAATDYDWNRTRSAICEKALRLVGAYGPGDPVSGTDMTVAADTLNDMVKEWQARDVFLWQLITIPLTSNPEDPLLPSTSEPIIGIESARWVNGVIEEKMSILAFSEYEDIPNKLETGSPRSIALNSNFGFGGLYIHPVPATSTNFTIRAVLPMKDWDTAGTTSGLMPSNWVSALAYGLAELLGDEYKLPLNERTYLQNKASYYFSRAKISDKNRSDRNVVRGAF